MGKESMSISVSVSTRVVCDGSDAGPCQHHAAADFAYPSKALVGAAAQRSGWEITDLAVCPDCRAELHSPTGR